MALSLVVWPPRGSRLESVPTEKRFYSEALKAEIRERHAAGETIPQLAEKLGMQFGTVKGIAQCQNEKLRERRAHERRPAAGAFPD